MAIDANVDQQITDLQQRRREIEQRRAAREQAERDELAFLEQSAAELVDLQIEQADQDFDDHLSGAGAAVEANKEAVAALRAAMTAYDLPDSLKAYDQVHRTFDRLRSYNEGGMRIVWNSIALQAGKMPRGPNDGDFQDAVKMRNLTRGYFNRLTWGIDGGPAVAHIVGQERAAKRKRVLAGIALALTGRVINPAPEYDPVADTLKSLQQEIVGHY